MQKQGLFLELVLETGAVFRISVLRTFQKQTLFLEPTLKTIPVFASIFSGSSSELRNGNFPFLLPGFPVSRSFCIFRITGGRVFRNFPFLLHFPFYLGIEIFNFKKSELKKSKFRINLSQFLDFIYRHQWWPTTKPQSLVLTLSNRIINKAHMIV